MPTKYATPSRFSHFFFIVALLFYIVAGYILLTHIPYSFPFGGPDEIMHLSMAEYIAKHLAWPHWDSTEVMRNAYGVSYSAGGSIVYWLHGLTFKLFGTHRIGAYILLWVYLGFSLFFYRKNPLAGWFMLALLLPQTLFVFSYVNSDSGTVVTALMFGIATAAFVTSERSVKRFLAFLFFAGLTITARQHLWALAFVTFLWVLYIKRRDILAFDKRIWIVALLLGLAPASWWFVTSYIANDGDILGVFTNAKSIAKFGMPNLPPLARSWHDFSIAAFLHATALSLYANWGWMSLGLHPIEYTVALLFAVGLLAMLYRTIEKRLFFFGLFLLALNFGLMILYSVSYDYQPQGRYLFPSLYILVGIYGYLLAKKPVVSPTFKTLLTLFTLFNLYTVVKLTATSYIDAFVPAVHRADMPKHPYTLTQCPAAYHLDQFQIGNGKLIVRGWAFDKRLGAPYTHTAVVLANATRSFAGTLETQRRPDVAGAFRNPKLDASGIAAKMLSLKPVEHGTYRLYLRFETSENRVVCDLNRTLRF